MEKLYRTDLSCFVNEQLDRRFVQTQISPELKAALVSVMKDSESFEEETFQSFSLEELFTYLKASHCYYLNIWIPKIENTILQLHHKMRDQYWSVKLLSLFFSSYKKELKEHIEFEEEVLFKFVDQLIIGEFTEQQRDIAVNHFIHNHNNNVVIQLDKLRQEVLTLDETLAGNILFEVLFNQLSIFQKDLQVHQLIEDHVFLPKAVVLAQRS
ncbi:MAG: hypothetical protein HUJ25_04370 [Crocinitomicaceae bacterium]|nr:hypothetical protein [Crocinitomicaceae bacterium]